MPTKPSFSRMIVVAVLVVAVAFGSGVAFASHQFNDVPTSSIFHDEIDFLASREITLGCGNGNYCPGDYVTREQMAAFLERMARALSPTVLSTTGLGLTAGVQTCILGPFTPEFEGLAIFEGAIYSLGSGNIFGRVNYRENGGVWRSVDNAWDNPSSPEASKYGNAPTFGNLQLTPGTSYEFSINPSQVGSTGTSGGCQLSAVIHHQMPSDVPGPAVPTPEPVQQELVE